MYPIIIGCIILLIIIILLVYCKPVLKNNLISYPPSNDNEPIVLLSLDGGGIRGVLHIEFLKLLLGDKPPNSVFDYYAGTSIGAIVALSVLLNNKIPTVDIKSTISRTTGFQKLLKFLHIIPKYNNKVKELIIKKYIPSVNLKSLPIFIPIMEVSKDATGTLIDGSQDVNSIDVASASSACPTFFPPVTIKIDNTYRTFIDGALVANNPTLLAYSKLRSLYPKRQIKVLSLGTGISLDLSNINNNSGRDWINTIVNPLNHGHKLLMNQSIDILKDLIGDDYVRIDYHVDELSLDNTSEMYIDRLKELAYGAYIKNKEKLKGLHR